MKISFHGGTREVTGSCYLLETKETKILIDCGLFQGGKECEDLNFEKFSFQPSDIDALFITHAHLDHVGRIPKLIREGFTGTIVSTPPTRELAHLLLEDALGIAMREHQKDLYTEADLERAFSFWKDLPYGQTFRVGDVAVTFHNAGHILGSALVLCEVEGKRIWFTGDLGNVPSLLLPPPDSVLGADYMTIESAYGNRVHEASEDRIVKLERAVEDTVARGGTLMIPAFATERTQEILHVLNEMVYFRRIPEIPVFVDAPLAIRITRVYEKYHSYYREEIQELLRQHPNLFKFKKLIFTERAEESKRINDVRPPKIIIAGSGMMNGGRILHHLRRYLSDERSILLVVGYQGAGSLGRKLIEGEKAVKVFGEEMEVKADIRRIDGFSAHADNPQLLSFVGGARDTLKKVFVVQGEEAASLHLMHEIRDNFGVDAEAPTLHETVELV